MTPAEFKTKWAKVTAKETSAYVEHFNDLCRMLRLPTPLQADPSGNDFFCFQKRVVKDAELFDLADSGEEQEPGERGFADVWKKGCFAWEYKGKKKNLDEAYKQLLRYRESLENPPLLVVCDFDRFIIKTNFNGTVQDVHEFTNAQIDDPKKIALLRHLFTDPDFLKPQRTTAQVTETLAVQIAEVAKSLQKRECAELTDARTRAEANFAQRKNLRIARFLNRIVFCLFAEDTRLLPEDLFKEILKAAPGDTAHFAKTLEELFRVMATGGSFGQHKIRHFNGHLFEDATVFELNEDELRILGEAADADWQFIEPSIMGTLFQRALDEQQRAALGAQYTGETDIRDLVEPVLMAPLRREWAGLKGELAAAFKKGKGTSQDRARITAFLKKLQAVIVLDPACGSGNFLYVSLQLLLGLEKEVITFAVQLGFRFDPEVSVQQLRAIEINPYAFELAQVSVQVGFLQWRRDNGFDNDRTPVLQNLDGFENKDALLHQVFRHKPKDLKAAQAEEHAEDKTLKSYVERDWPACDVLVGNPPFLGTKKLRSELGDDYVEELFRIYGRRIPNFSDLCCYWFEKAREQIERGLCKRAGLLATQGIRGGLNREVLKRILESGGIYFAESDRNWVLDGAAVHVSMVGFDDGTDTTRMLDGESVLSINANLTTRADTTQAKRLPTNRAIGFIADVKAGKFDLAEAGVERMLPEPNPHGRPNSDVLLPWVNSLDVLRRPRDFWIVDFGVDGSEEFAGRYHMPFAMVKSEVHPARAQVKRKSYRDYWWLHAEPCAEMREHIWPLSRFLVTTTVSKHRVFAWLSAPTLPDHQLVAFGRADDYFFGVLHSRCHEVWALAQGTQLREKESGFRYTPTTCFETFPFPFPDDLHPQLTPTNLPPLPQPNREQAEMDAAKFYAHIVLREEPVPYRAGSRRGKEADSSAAGSVRLLTSAATKEEHSAAIAAAAKELNELRERWLNPPEWTETRTLEFPGSVTGPWARYVDAATVNAKTGIGTVRFPRLEPRDADSAAKLKKRTLTNLYNERPAWLDLAHKKVDAAVAAAYGFPADLSDEQILERLLALNLERAAEEAKAAKVKKPKLSRAKAEGELI